MKRIMLWIVLFFLIIFLIFMLSLKFFNIGIPSSDNHSNDGRISLDTNKSSILDVSDYDSTLVSFQRSTFNRNTFDLIKNYKDYYGYSLNFDSDYLSFCNDLDSECIKFKYSVSNSSEDEYTLYDLDGNDVSDKYQLVILSGVYCLLDYTIDSVNYDIYYFN